MGHISVATHAGQSRFKTSRPCSAQTVALQQRAKQKWTSLDQKLFLMMKRKWIFFSHSTKLDVFQVSPPVFIHVQRERNIV